MKNILNKIGAVSKPVVFGAALGVATVAVGVGVATHFMSDGPKGASGRVLSQYSGDVASVGSGAGGYNNNYSREALEQQMAAARAEREGTTALAYLGNAGRGKLAYGSKGTAYEGGVVDPMAMNNAEYEDMGDAAQPGMSQEVASAMNNFNSTAAAAVRGGKGAKGANGEASEADAEGEEKGRLEKAEGSFGGTKLNKLNKSSGFGGGSFGGKGGSSSASRNMGAIMGAAANVDRPGQQAIAGANLGNVKGDVEGVAGAKHGRLGAMGGANARGAHNGSGSGQAYFTSTLGELTAAQHYSALSKGSVYGNSEKGFVEAAQAFDGSGDPNEGVQIAGDTPMVTRAAALEGSANKINKKNNIGKINDITADSQTITDAKKGIMATVMTMVSIALVGIGIVMALKSGGYTSWIAPVVAAAFAAVIIGLGMGLISMYVNQIKHVATEGLNDAGAWDHMRWWLPPLIGGLPFLGLCAKGASAGAKASFTLSKLGTALVYGGGMSLLSGLTGFFK